MSRRIRPHACLALGFLLLVGSSAFSRPPYKQALADYFGPFLARKLYDCRTCHLSADLPGDETSSDQPKPHNSFGARLKEVKNELRRAGKKTTIAARLDAVALEDSDHDGTGNLMEILTGHFPGDPSDKPTAAEMAAAQKTLAAFQEFKKAYPWRPFESVQPPATPFIHDASWVRNPIDAFIAVEHELHGLKPRPEAAKEVLLRRVYLDLIGLPPTPEELHAFLADPSEQAYERVVDRLLVDPRYGERWGRHWMDVWRYSDWAGWTDGGQIRDSQPHIWRWRDWIVESLNQDKGYDRMILEMLAADELAPDDLSALRATGYLARNYKMLSREKWLQDTIKHTGQAFLGITLDCARCHDHMYDPITQEEYYRVRAIFEPHQARLDFVPGEVDVKKDGLARVYDADLQAPTYFLVRGDDRSPDKSRQLEPGLPEALHGTFPPIVTVKLSTFASAPAKRGFVLQASLKAEKAEAAQARAGLAGVERSAVTANLACIYGPSLLLLVSEACAQKASDSLALALLNAQVAEARFASSTQTAKTERLEDEGKINSAAWKQASQEACRVQRLARLYEARLDLLKAFQAQSAAGKTEKSATAKKVSAARQALAKATEDGKRPSSTSYTKRRMATYPKTSTGRRLAFARWIAGKDNPLTARVAMNHIWLRHFGQAIVPSVFDFGRNGRQPSHPALLDWLAAEFMEGHWSMKAMHRLIVTSSTYRMASSFDAASAARDNDNRYLWRMPTRRLEAEAVRDCIFYVADKLDPRMGGPEIDQNMGLSVPRRSLYFRHAAEKEMEFLKIFDCASVTECYQRKESILPQQALALANSDLTLRHARVIAADVTSRVGLDNHAFVEKAVTKVLSRLPMRSEMTVCLQYLDERAGRVMATASRDLATRAGVPCRADAMLQARASLVHVLLNHNDFVTVR